MRNSKSSKAYYRSAVALLALERLDEALDCCDRCLAFDRDNMSVQAVRKQAATKKTAREQKEKDRLEKLRQQREEERRMKVALKVSAGRIAIGHVFLRASQ